MSLNRKKASNADLIHAMISSVINAMKYDWSDRRNRTIQLDIKELMHRLEPETQLTDQELNDLIF